MQLDKIIKLKFKITSRVTYDSKWGQLSEHPDEVLGLVSNELEDDDGRDDDDDGSDGWGCDSGCCSVWIEEQQVVVVVVRWIVTVTDGGAERKKTDIFGPWWRGNG